MQILLFWNKIKVSKTLKIKNFSDSRIFFFNFAKIKFTIKFFEIKNILNSLIFIPTPSNIRLIWNFGSLLGLSILIQVISGFFISIHYNSEIVLSFNSYILLSKIINNGIIIQIIHGHVSSVIFIFIYIHIFKSLLNKSFNKKLLWIRGNIILLITIGSAFLGYVLPWGQISFWGATVITNIISSIPFIGNKLTNWIWGGFSVNNATLNRFFSLHFLIPFIILFISLFHLNILHIKGSSNQIGLNSNLDKIFFGKRFIFKDLISIFIFLIIYYIIFLIIVDHHFIIAKENFFPADPLNTPVHIKPEWYFIFAYALLRSIPRKIGGILSLLIVYLIFFFLIYKNSNFSKFFFLKKVVLTLFLINFILLTNLGYKIIEAPFTTISLNFGIFFILFIYLI